MAGKGSMTAWIAGGGVALLLVLPAPARACEAHQAAAQAKVSADAKLDAEVKATTATAKPDAKKQPELLAEKCKCDGASTCTCKKGQCQCSKCSKPRYRVMESLRERPQTREVKVRRNAAAGTFI
jgi:hypothetical protein